MLERTIENTERMARSAMPFSSCTWGGQVDWATLSASSRSLYSRDRNSPALSVWIAATLKASSAPKRLASKELKLLTNVRVYSGASDFRLIKYTHLYLV